MLKNLPATTGGARDVGLITGSGKSLEVGNGNPLGNPMDRVVWWATVHDVAESQT